MNEEITSARVRLIGKDGEQIGIVPVQEALRLSEEAESDLVEIVPNSEPPVCRIINYGKYLFEQTKKKQAAKKKQKQIQIKEVKFRPSTEIGDYQVKIRNVTRFLTNGDKVKVTLRFRGREMVHQKLGAQMLERIETDLKDYGVVEQHAKLEGRQMVMLFAPKR